MQAWGLGLGAGAWAPPACTITGTTTFGHHQQPGGEPTPNSKLSVTAAWHCPTPNNHSLLSTTAQWSTINNNQQRPNLAPKKGLTTGPFRGKVCRGVRWHGATWGNNCGGGWVSLPPKGRQPVSASFPQQSPPMGLGWGLGNWEQQTWGPAGLSPPPNNNTNCNVPHHQCSRAIPGSTGVMGFPGRWHGGRGSTPTTIKQIQLGNNGRVGPGGGQMGR